MDLAALSRGGCCRITGPGDRPWRTRAVVDSPAFGELPNEEAVDFVEDLPLWPDRLAQVGVPEVLPVVVVVSGGLGVVITEEHVAVGMGQRQRCEQAHPLAVLRCRSMPDRFVDS